MKKLILSALAPLLYLLFSLSPCALTHAQAQPSASAGGYACILNSDTFFYAQRNENSGLFLLPKTYYVKLLEVSPDFCKIEYLYDDTHVKKLIGYAKTSELTFVDYVPKRPYLYHLFDVSYRIDNAQSSSSVLDKITITCAYYGDYIIGSQAYCYVLRDGTFGYVPKPTELSYEENTEYAEWLSLTQDPTESEPLNTDKPSSSTSPAQIAILIAVCLLVPTLAALILRSSKKQPFEDEEE